MPYVGIAISLWPMIVPGHFSLWEAASSDSMQAFLLIGTLLMLPVLFGVSRQVACRTSATSEPGPVGGLVVSLATVGVSAPVAATRWRRLHAITLDIL